MLYVGPCINISNLSMTHQRDKKIYSCENEYCALKHKEAPSSSKFCGQCASSLSLKTVQEKFNVPLMEGWLFIDSSENFKESLAPIGSIYSNCMYLVPNKKDVPFSCHHLDTSSAVGLKVPPNLDISSQLSLFEHFYAKELMAIKERCGKAPVVEWAIVYST